MLDGAAAVQLAGRPANRCFRPLANEPRFSERRALRQSQSPLPHPDLGAIALWWKVRPIDLS